MGSWAAVRGIVRAHAAPWLATALLLFVSVLPRTASAGLATADLPRAEQRLMRAFQERGVTYPPRAVTLIALKNEGRLEVWADGGNGSWTFLRSYLVRATSGKLGPKLRQGDHQVPEGIYQVSALNPRSRYHLALRLGYPNDFDRARGDEEGRDALGSDIMIHGDRVSDGCLPIGDESIEEVFALASTIGIESVSVVVTPVDFRRTDVRSALARVQRAPRWLPALYADLARTLATYPLPSSDELRALPPRRQAPGKVTCRPYDAVDCEKRCRAGEAASCARAGVLYRDGRGTTRDPLRAWSLLTVACKRGDATGCGALGDLLLSDDGMLLDTSRAAVLAKSACDAGDGHGCASLARQCSDKLLYPSAVAACDRDSVDLLRRRAIANLTTRCSGWGAYDCFTLATIYAADDDLDSARLFASQSCQAGDPGGCDQLGFLYQLSGDVVRARSLYEKSCAAGYTRACGRFGGTITAAGTSSTSSGG
jgi:TPR repeat protein